MKREHIVCVDDEVVILQSLRRELKSDPFFRDVDMALADNGAEALDVVKEIMESGGSVSLIISDQRMPRMTGDALLAETHRLLPDSMNILLTGYSDIDAVIKLVNTGALYRYLSKPWDRHDLLLTAREALLANRQKMLIKRLNRKIENLTLAMVSALESANLYFDEETGAHIRRIAAISGYIAKKAGLDDEFVRLIELYSPLHDIGKIGIPKEILLKPAKLSCEEFEHIKEHVNIGFRILENDGIEPMAKNIVQYHHEKWEGSGYTRSLAGEDIPIEARIVSIADVFDALTHKRVYKPAYSQAEAIKYLIDGRGTNFDPRLVDIFLEGLASAEYPGTAYGGQASWTSARSALPNSQPCA